MRRIAFLGVLVLLACSDSPTELPGSRYSNMVRADQPIVYWRFEESTGLIAADSSGNGRTAHYLPGAIMGGTFGGANTGRAVSLQTSSDGVVSASNTWSGMQTFSVEAWVRPVEVTSPEGVIIVDKGETWNLILEPDGRPAIQFPGGAHKAVASAPLQAGQTYHLVGTQTNGSFVLYVNGQLAATFTSARRIDVRDRPVHVGRGLTSGSWEFVGSIDEVAIYDRVLSPGSVIFHYNAGK